ncbi:MAG: ABC transporter permease, partial [Terriglobales bacterium]
TWLDGSGRLAANVHVVSPGYFRVLGLPVQAGRGLDAGDTATAPAVAVVDGTIVNVAGARANGIVGKHFRLEFHRGVVFAVVGVAGPTRGFGLEAAPLPQIYLSQDQFPKVGLTVFLRSATPPTVKSVQAISAASGLPARLGAILPLSRLRGDADALPLLRWRLLLAIAALGMALAASGVLLFVNLEAMLRRREYGIRVALGSAPMRIFTDLLRRAAGWTAIGVGLGLVILWPLENLLKHLLFDAPSLWLPDLSLCALALELAVVAGTLPIALRLSRRAAAELFQGS